jgi:pimeloyl-ACP methyl ester carboxylesterase
MSGIYAISDEELVCLCIIVIPLLRKASMFGRKPSDNSQPNEESNMTGLIKISGCDNPSRRGDVVFVHGLAGDARNTWHWQTPGDRDYQKDNFWLTWLAEDLKKEGIDVGIWTFGYEAARSKWAGEAMPLFDQASKLLKDLQIQDIGKFPLIFITHSMGGLLVKKTLRNANDIINSPSIYKEFYQELIDKTKGLVFLSTPHTGSHLADLIANISTLTQSTVNVEELRDNEPQLRELNEWYRDNVVQLKIATEVYYEQKLIFRTLVVNPDSANPGISGVKPTGLLEDHNSIAKPKSRTATVYGGVKLFIKTLLKQTQRQLPAADDLISLQQTIPEKTANPQQPL